MDYKLARTIDEIEKYLGECKIVAFDFETAPTDDFREEEFSALDPHKSDITGISFSVKKSTGIYVPLRHREYKNADPETIMRYLKGRFFENGSIVKVAHNLAFEAMFLYKHGIVVQEPVYDTIAASQLTLKNDYEFRTLGDSGLKTLVPYLYGIDLPKFEEVVKEGQFDELCTDDWETIRYACADSDYTLQLYHTFNEWFNKNLPKHRGICENLESPVAVYTGMMKYNGIAVDKELMLSKKANAETKMISLREKILYIIGDVDIGENCGTQAFKNYLYKELKLPVLKTTSKFHEAADDEAIQLLYAYCKANRPELIGLMGLVQEYRKWSKIKSTYLDGYLKFINSKTGRIHADLMPMGTDTGRFAARKPNLQNMPRKTNDPIGIRDCLVAKRGAVFLGFDFSQIELRVGAFYCRDERMINTYKNGGDIHAQTTAVIFGKTEQEAADKVSKSYKEQRTIAKNCNFGVFYGLFAKGLQRTLKFKGGVDKSLSECEEIIKNLKLGYPDLSSWQKKTIYSAKRTKYSETHLGRRRYLKGINSAEWGVRSYNERCALNTPIQGTAADILKLAMARLVKELRTKDYIRPILQIHDELLFEVDKDKLDDAVNVIKKAMEEKPFNGFDLPIVAEGEKGLNYGNMEEL